MSKKANPAMIGLFVVVASILILLALVLAGAGDMFQKKFKVVVHFSDSISGLDVGAPVEFQGVRIGAVSDIRLVFNPATDQSRTPVVLTLEPHRWELEEDAQDSVEPMEKLPRLLEDGLCAQMETASLLTGKLKVVLKFDPEVKKEFLGVPVEYPEVPTIRMSLSQVKKSLEDLPLTEMIQDAHQLFSNLADVSDPEQLGSFRDSLEETFQRVSSLSVALESQLEPVGSSLVRVADQSGTMMTQVASMLTNMNAQIEVLAESLTDVSTEASSVLDHADDFLQSKSMSRIQLELALKEFASASRSLRTLVEYLEQRPEALIHGKKEN